MHRADVRILFSPSAPCVPTQVMAPRTCGQTFVHVSWNASRGALRYRAAAVDDDGNRLTCSSNETSCMLEGLVCSRVYSVGVSAVDDTCSSNASSANTLRAGRNEQDSKPLKCACIFSRTLNQISTTKHFFKSLCIHEKVRTFSILTHNENSKAYSI